MINDKQKLTLDEYEKVKESFINVFNLLMSSYVKPGDIEELTTHLAEFYSSFRLYQIGILQTVQDYNRRIFSNSLISGFYLDLLDRFSMEIAPIGEDTFDRLILTFAFASHVCKAVDIKDKDRQDGLEPILCSISVRELDMVSIYKTNPWFVILVLINTQFLNTELGQSVKHISKKS